jgi:hypothetical protein
MRIVHDELLSLPILGVAEPRFGAAHLAFTGGRNHLKRRKAGCAAIATTP